MTKWRVACIDLDGTLVVGTSTCQHLGVYFGHGEVIRRLERRYAAGEMSNRDVALEDAKYYRGRRIADVAHALESLPLIRGIERTVTALHDRGMRVLLTTVTWSFAAKIVAERFGFDGWSGCVMAESQDGILSGTVEQHFTEFDKVRYVERYCQRYRIEMEGVLAVGDSRSDIPLFQVVGHSIAVNATEAARKAASCAIETNDLFDVLAEIPNA